MELYFCICFSVCLLLVILWCEEVLFQLFAKSKQILSRFIYRKCSYKLTFNYLINLINTFQFNLINNYLLIHLFNYLIKYI